MTESQLSAPRIWVLASYRAGENSQLRGLADALAEPYRLLRVGYRGGAAGLFNIARGVGLHGIRSPHDLQEPWPRVLISAGLRNEPVARWVRRASDGYTRIVFVGRTWAPLAEFDLIITTPQYRLPTADNVLHNPITLQNLTAEVLAAARTEHASRFEHLPRPHIGLLVGGDSGPFALRRRGGERLAAAATAYAHRRGGSVLASTSSRTHPAAARALEAALTGRHLIYRWQPDDPANPYLGILADADELIVTSDSVAMLSEALTTRVPVRLWDVGRYGDATLGAASYRTLMRIGPQRLTRDVARVHARLIDSGHAQLLEPRSDGRVTPPPCEDLGATARQRAVDAVRALLD